MPGIRIPGVPDFTDDDRNPYSIDDIAGWWDTPPVRTSFVANGGGHGSIAAGQWTYGEKFSVLRGTVVLPAAQQAAPAAAIRRAFPIGADTALTYLGGAWETDKQIFVRCYDVIKVVRDFNHFTFEIPLAQGDPFKYGLNDTYTATIGVFTGQTWSRTYNNTAGTAWSRTYAHPSGTLWTRGYTYSDTAYGGLPNAAAIASDGDVASQRVTLDITGPLPQGWYIRNEVTGEKLYSKVAIPDQVTLTLDCYQRTARLDGRSVDAKTFGDWLTLTPGGNDFRLYGVPALGGGAGYVLPTTAHCRITALPAYL